MTVQENLATLESLHQDVANAIIAMREMVRIGDDLKDSVATAKYAEIKRMVGDAQRKSDTLEDFRSHGTWTGSQSD
jgi:hypothetical protein